MSIIRSIAFVCLFLFTFPKATVAVEWRKRVVDPSGKPTSSIVSPQNINKYFKTVKADPEQIYYYYTRMDSGLKLIGIGLGLGMPDEKGRWLLIFDSKIEKLNAVYVEGPLIISTLRL